METTLLHTLAKQYALTSLEPAEESYILTPEDEKAILAYEIERLQKHFSWRHRDVAFSEGEILKRMAEIDWEKSIDRETILRLANSRKHRQIWHQQQAAQERANAMRKLQEAAEEQAQLQKLCDAKYFLNLMSWTSENNFRKKLITNEHNAGLIHTLCYFLSGDIRFEKELELDPNKGLLIRGISGLGKTYLVKCVAKNKLKPISIVPMLRVADMVRQTGKFELVTEPNGIVYLDDVGTEQPTVMHYGTKINFFKDYIEGVHLYPENYNRIIISTNNDFDEIQEKYGYRVRSRIREMFNIVDIYGTDMRE